MLDRIPESIIDISSDIDKLCENLNSDIPHFFLKNEEVIHKITKKLITTIGNLENLKDQPGKKLLYEKYRNMLKDNGTILFATIKGCSKEKYYIEYINSDGGKEIQKFVNCVETTDNTFSSLDESPALPTHFKSPSSKSIFYSDVTANSISFFSNINYSELLPIAAITGISTFVLYQCLPPACKFLAMVPILGMAYAHHNHSEPSSYKR